MDRVVMSISPHARMVHFMLHPTAQIQMLRPSLMYSRLRPPPHMHSKESSTCTAACSASQNNEPTVSDCLNETHHVHHFYQYEYLHYKMKRHRPGAGLCYFGLRCVSATQTCRAVCVSTVLCQIDTLRRRIVFSSVAHLISITNDRLP